MSLSMGQFGITIDGGRVSGIDQKDYETRVSRIITQLSQHSVPRAVFFKIKTHGWLRGGAKIMPMNPQNDSLGSCNATGYDPEKDHRDGGFWDPGTATVQFTPQTFSSGKCSGGPGWSPEEVLLHELVHAARFMGGDDAEMKPLRISMKAYNSEEEFFAILVTNIYISETGRNILRANHIDRSALASGLTNSETFLAVQEHRRLIEKFCRQHPNIAPMIGRANAAFNPIKAYYSEHWYTRHIVN